MEREHPDLSDIEIDDAPGIAMPCPAGDLWVFAYGSLMWDPGFDYDAARVARLYGYHRALCVWSIRYRGTPERPGLVLGLDRGGSCVGRAFRVPLACHRQASDYLRDRELVTGAYRPALQPVVLDDGTSATALTFIVDRRHRQYAGVLPIERMASTVRIARGRRGPNADYVLNTAHQLGELKIRDPRLERLIGLLAAA